MESGPACLPFDVLELFTWLERKLNNQVVHGSSSPTPRLESMRIKSHIWWTWKLGWLHSNINAFFLGQAKVIIWGTCFLSRKFGGYVDLHDGQWRKLSWSVRKKGHWRPLKSKIIVEIISVKTNWPVLHCPLTISLNRLFDYRLDAVKLRVTRQSIWRRWFVRAFLSTNGLHFAANARVTSPLSKDCHKRQDLEWR